MNLKPIFTITTIDDKPPGDRRSRCIGYYHEYDAAEEIVIDNGGDMWETIYTYAVIEKVFPGLYSHDTDPKWFKHDIPTGKYIKLDDNPLDKNVCGYGIG